MPTHLGKHGMEILVTRYKVKDIGILHLRNFYKDLYEYFLDKEYAVKDADFPEIYYWENRHQLKGRETWIWWRPSLSLKVQKRIAPSQFWTKLFRVNFHTKGMKDREIVYKGKKLKLQEGMLEIFVFAYLVIDEKGMWRKGIMKTLFEIFWRRIFYKTLEQHRKDLLRDAYEFEEYMKQSLKHNIFYMPKMEHMRDDVRYQ